VPERPIGILGGTFDPIHNGHLRLAIELRDSLKLGEVRLVPSARPPHRDQPSATPGQRAKWVRVAIADQPGIVLDDRELLRSGPSYTVDTLAHMRETLPDTPLCLIMGADVFAELPQWHRWEALFDYAHIILVNRPGVSQDYPRRAREVLERRRGEAQALHDSLHGAIHPCAPPPLEISGTRIRELIAAGASPRFLLPDPVLRDIMDAGIYRPAGQTPA
jgi:nicotinate-nucleotide adenylyltransferase